VEQAEAVGAQEEVLSLDVADDLGRWRLQTAGADVLEGDVELTLFRLTTVNGGSDEDIALVGIHVPQAVAVGDHGARSKGCIRHRRHPWRY
jgi:hypothetical protein